MATVYLVQNKKVIFNPFGNNIIERIFIMQKKKKTILIIVSFVILLLGGIIISNTSKTSYEAKTNNNLNKEIKVSINGYVKYPNEYYVSPYTKIKDLIVIAGGVLEDGDISLINLEKTVEAGECIYINKMQNNNSKINVNKASIDSLKKDLKLTITQANNLVAYRNINGPFTNAYDLMKVDGIKIATLNEIINKICL